MRPDELIELLEARRGHFLLESGHHGDMWLELEFCWTERSAAGYRIPEALRGGLDGKTVAIVDDEWEPADCPMCAAGTPLD